MGAFGRSIVKSLPPQSTSSNITYAWRGGLHTVGKAIWWRKPQTVVAPLLDGILKIIADHQPCAGDVGGMMFVLHNFEVWRIGWPMVNVISQLPVECAQTSMLKADRRLYIHGYPHLTPDTPLDARLSSLPSLFLSFFPTRPPLETVLYPGLLEIFLFQWVSNRRTAHPSY